MLLVGVGLGVWSCGSYDDSPAEDDGLAGSGGSASGIGGAASGVGGAASGVGGDQGVGGDGSTWSAGSFFEGAMTIGCPDDNSLDDAIQANIVAAGTGADQLRE